MKQTGSKTFAIISSFVLATSPFFITASKLVSLDLLYMAIYISTTFIFTSNVYSNSYSKMYTFVAGILIACCFSLTGLIGTIPILINYLLINFIRGGFLINLKFNNPIIIALGFIAFTVIWVVSLGKVMGFSKALDLVFNYQFLDNFAEFEFDEGKVLKYITLFVIGGFPWISLLPAGIWATLRSLPQRLHTSSLQTSLPLICLFNAIMLSIYFASVEQEFYILLTIYFNFAVIIADRIYNIEVNKLSFLNIIFVAYSVATMLLFLNEFLNINIVNYHFDTTIKELLLNENTSISGISNDVFYIMAGSYFLGATLLFIYGLTRNKFLLNLSLASAILNLVIFVFAVFPNLKNAELNNSRNINSWLDYAIEKDVEVLTFYKLKDPIIASKAEKSFYFDDAVKLKNFTDRHNDKLSYLFFNKSDRNLMVRLNKNSRLQCRNEICFIKL